MCAYLSYVTLGKKLTNCQLSGYINGYDGKMDKTVSGGAILRGFESVHDNYRE